ncbi:MAG TPA: hypothetical protein VF281_02845 [Candidatus Saccharimonadales bacterium]
MSKQNKPSVRFRRPSITLTIATLSLVGTLAIGFVVGTYIYAQQQTEQIDATEHFKQTMRISYLETCYENNIHPCTQEAINKFYESEPQQ